MPRSYTLKTSTISSSASERLLFPAIGDKSSRAIVQLDLHQMRHSVYRDTPAGSKAESKMSVFTHVNTSEIVLGVLHHNWYIHNAVRWRSRSVACVFGGARSHEHTHICW